MIVKSRNSRRVAPNVQAMPLGSGRMNTRVSQVQIAVMTLTRIPVGQLSNPAPEMASARWAYPIVGALVGAIIGSAVVVGEWLGLPVFVSAMLGVVAGLFATGAIHEDGLADCADGFWGGREKVRKLEIMRDSRIGTYGTLALIASFGLRSAAFASLAAVVVPIIAVSALSRFAMVVALERLPTARADGLGAAAANGESQLALAGGLAAVAAVTLTVVVGPGTAFAVFIAMSTAGIGAATLALRHIGGQTGDVLGAVQQVTEIAGLIALSAMVV